MTTRRQGGRVIGVIHRAINLGLCPPDLKHKNSVSLKENPLPSSVSGRRNNCPDSAPEEIGRRLKPFHIFFLSSLNDCKIVFILPLKKTARFLLHIILIKLHYRRDRSCNINASFSFLALHTRLQAVCLNTTPDIYVKTNCRRHYFTLVDQSAKTAMKCNTSMTSNTQYRAVRTTQHIALLTKYWAAPTDNFFSFQ